MSSMRVHLEAYGYSASFADAEMIGGVLQQAGYQVIDDSSTSNLNLIVTCTVKTPTATLHTSLLG